MNHKAEYDKLNSFDWKRKAAIITSYYYAGNTVWICAKYFEVSIGYVSEAVKLIDKFDDVKDCKNRTEALLLLRNGKL